MITHFVSPDNDMISSSFRWRIKKTISKCSRCSKLDVYRVLIVMKIPIARKWLFVTSCSFSIESRSRGNVNRFLFFDYFRYSRARARIAVASCTWSSNRRLNRNKDSSVWTRSICSNSAFIRGNLEKTSIDVKPVSIGLASRSCHNAWQWFARRRSLAISLRSNTFEYNCQRKLIARGNSERSIAFTYFRFQCPFTREAAPRAPLVIPRPLRDIYVRVYIYMNTWIHEYAYIYICICIYARVCDRIAGSCHLLGRISYSSRAFDFFIRTLRERGWHKKSLWRWQFPLTHCVSNPLHTWLHA